MTRPKLLLADDSVTIRNVVEQTFSDEGFDVTTAINGEEAMQKLTSVQPDIVILDVDMPEPTGYKICEHIKGNEKTRHIPVLLIVGSFEPFDENEAERVRADGFLTKPFQSIRDLIIRVEELLGPQDRSVSPAETADIDHLFERSISALEDESGEPSFEMILGDPGMDDEIIEASYPSRDMAADDEIVVASEAGVSELDGVMDLQGVVDGENGVSDAVQLTSRDEPSEEFVALVVGRVLEKLSDKVVREIAKEAVPRIAEKLIREALKEEKKN